MSNSQTATLPFSGTWTRTLPVRILLILTATFVVAAAARVSVPLWFTPVPLTLQPLAVLAVGLALGPVDSGLALLTYIAEGAIGLPVFSPVVGLTGMAHLLGPTGGYLMAYPFVAATAGTARRLAARLPKFLAGALACTAGSLVMFAVGAAWFSEVTHLSARLTWAEAVVPFLAGAAINICVAAGAFASIARSEQR